VMQKMNAASLAELVNMAATLLPVTKPDRVILGNSQLAPLLAEPALPQSATLSRLPIRKY
jgi:hypothetical protein